MATAASRPFLLFAGGEPDRRDDGMAIVSNLHRARVFVQIPPKRREEGPLLDANGRPRWHFRTEQGSAVRLAVEIAKAMGKEVRVIDVNRPATEGDPVDRYVTAETHLPVLISPDGRRLEGLESFVPSRLKRFLALG